MKHTLKTEVQYDWGLTLVIVHLSSKFEVLTVTLSDQTFFLKFIIIIFLFLSDQTCWPGFSVMMGNIRINFHSQGHQMQRWTFNIMVIMHFDYFCLHFQVMYQVYCMLNKNKLILPVFVFVTCPLLNDSEGTSKIILLHWNILFSLNSHFYLTKLAACLVKPCLWPDRLIKSTYVYRLVTINNDFRTQRWCIPAKEFELFCGSCNERTCHSFAKS